MMEIFCMTVTVLSLLSVGHSAPLINCESLVKPVTIQSQEQLLGTWTYIAESTDVPGATLLTKILVDSAWIRISANQSNALDVFHAQKMFGSCYTLRAEMKVLNGRITMGPVFVSQGVILNSTCSDCLVILSSTTIGNSVFKSVNLLSKKTKVSAAELEEFNQQVKCLNLPPVAKLNEDLAPCVADSPDNTDLTNDTKAFGPGFLTYLKKALNYEEWIEMLISYISSRLRASLTV